MASKVELTEATDCLTSKIYLLEKNLRQSLAEKLTLKNEITTVNKRFDFAH